MTDAYARRFLGGSGSPEGPGSSWAIGVWLRRRTSARTRCAASRRRGPVRRPQPRRPGRVALAAEASGFAGGEGKAEQRGLFSVQRATSPKSRAPRWRRTRVRQVLFSFRACSFVAPRGPTWAAPAVAMLVDRGGGSIRSVRTRARVCARSAARSRHRVLGDQLPSRRFGKRPFTEHPAPAGRRRRTRRSRCSETRSETVVSATAAETRSRTGGGGGFMAPTGSRPGADHGPGRLQQAGNRTTTTSMNAPRKVVKGAG